MKDLERKFFRYCCKNLTHDSREHSSVLKFRDDKNFVDLLYEFSEKYNVSQKQLYTYISKWDSRGVVDYGVSLLYGWFKFDSRRINIDQYVNAIPSRIICHNAELRRQLSMYEIYKKKGW